MQRDGQGKANDEKWYYSFLPNNMAGGSTSPLIPLFLTEGLGGTVAQVGLLSAISSMASVPSNILWGNLSDAVKKRSGSSSSSASGAWPWPCS